MQKQDNLAQYIFEYLALSNPNQVNKVFDHSQTTSTKTINVLLIGRSQTGKSTILTIIQDPHVAVKSRGFSETRELGFTPLSLYDDRTKETYVLNIIDTPGLSEK